MSTYAIKKVRIEGDIAYVPLTQGYEAIIDAADAGEIGRFNWYAMIARNPDGTIRTVYARRAVSIGYKRQVTCLMHRQVLGADDDLQIDHHDGNGLNNRRDNLRQATNTQNQYNRRLTRTSASGVKGVYWHSARSKWKAKIGHDGTETYLGSFATLEEAADAYARASRALHGEYGRPAVAPAENKT